MKLRDLMRLPRRDISCSISCDECIALFNKRTKSSVRFYDVLMSQRCPVLFMRFLTNTSDLKLGE